MGGRLWRDAPFVLLWTGQTVHTRPPAGTDERNHEDDRLRHDPGGVVRRGLLGKRLGVLPTLVVGAAVAMLAAVWILAGPVRLREQAAPAA